MSKFCAYLPEVGIISGNTLLFDFNTLSDQFSDAKNCTWFVDQMNEAAEEVENGPFCKVYEEWYCEEGNLYIVHTRDSNHHTVDGYDTKKEADDMMNKCNKAHKEWRLTNA